MPKITLALAAALIAVGVGFYLVALATSPYASWTALIPAFVGVVFLILGLIGLKPAARKHAMHVAAALALLGALGLIPRVIGALSADEPANPRAVTAQGITVLLLVVYVVLAVRSFIAARRARKAGEGSGFEPVVRQ